MTSLGDWISTYTAALRPELRPDLGNQRFIAEAGAAMRNQWDASRAASAVNAVRYDNAARPDAVAITELARITAHPPPSNHEHAPSTAAACPFRGCRCTHTGGCYRGWVDTDGPTTPCPQCRPDLARRVTDIPAPGRRSQADLAHLRERKTA